MNPTQISMNHPERGRKGPGCTWISGRPSSLDSLEGRKVKPSLRQVQAINFHLKHREMNFRREAVPGGEMCALKSCHMLIRYHSYPPLNCSFKYSKWDPRSDEPHVLPFWFAAAHQNARVQRRTFTAALHINRAKVGTSSLI